MSPPRDVRTMDLFAWEPPVLVHRFDEHRVRAATLRDRISLAVAETLKEAEVPRKNVAESMSAWLGEEVSENMLNAYASQAREDQTPSLLRAWGLAHATNDLRVFQMVVEDFGHAVIDRKWLPWVEVGQLADKKDEFDRAFDAARRNARRGIKP